ncbi:MAG: linear amide C-N hydrolase [Ruminococcus sp.]|nr:linear amide C-N hydrolase [Ruminococcus sp.]
MIKRTKKFIAVPILLLFAAGAICLGIFALGSFSGKAVCFALGGLLVIAAICMLISAISDRSFGKISLIAGAILCIPPLAAGIIFFNKIRSVLSIRQVGSGLYSMEYADILKTDKLLDTDIHSVSEMIEWLRKEEFCDLPFSIDEKRIGCAAFAAKTPEGNVLMGRNLDYDTTDTVMIHTAPKNGYASYAMADLAVLGVGSSGGMIPPDSAIGKILMLAAPYGVVDGINEKGLGAAILALEMSESHMNTDKHDLSIYTAIRVLLDKCATVDEALTLLAERDIHTGLGVSYHLFIEDKTGRSVAVEWLDGEMCVNELNAATNSVLTPGKYYDFDADERLPAINAELSGHNGILTKDEARDLLKNVSQSNTEWSCVYDLTECSFDVYMDKDFDNAIHFPQ